jgi:hypothetical protein
MSAVEDRGAAGGWQGGGMQPPPVRMLQVGPGGLLARLMPQDEQLCGRRWRRLGWPFR